MNPILTCSRCSWAYQAPLTEESLVRAVATLEQHLYEAHQLTFQRASEEAHGWLERGLLALNSPGAEGENE